MEKKPSDILDQIHGESNQENLPVKSAMSATSPKMDEGVKTIENRVRTGQNVLNDWRKTIVKNQEIILILCIAFGVSFSYAINECTGNFDFPLYFYVMAGSIIILVSFLLITEGSLPLIVLVKFALAITFGHVAMMWVIAVDGHGFGYFTTVTCRYPMNGDIFSGFLSGLGIMYVATTFKVGE